MLVQGAKVLVNRKFDEELFLKNIEKYQVTVLNVVPPILELLTHSPMADPKKSLASLRIIYVGAAAVRKDMENAVRHKFAEVELIQLYGSTESGILVFMVPRKEKFEELLAVKPGTCGIALPGVKTKVCFVL
uniref:AMP-dependent synthetase/ligase domain-containing protein n=1 Tax=Panagrolaimus sp. JU765 TaxID=591449 RepID=A0AC34RQF0_9BILA